MWSVRQAEERGRVTLSAWLSSHDRLSGLPRRESLMRAERSSAALYTMGNEIPVALSTGESRCSVPLPRCRTGLRGTRLHE